VRRLGPGVYVDANGALHVDAAELCAAHGYAPTEENQDMLIRAAREMFPPAVLTVLGARGEAAARCAHCGAVVADDPRRHVCSTPV
jgi:hypothetical protein